MKKLKTTYPDGFPLTLDRVRWMEDGINEAILALCRSLLPPGATSMIIEGCEIIETSQDVYLIQPGWIYLVQEGYEKICRVNSDTFNFQGSFPFPAVGLTPRWNSELVATTASVTFFDGTSRHVEYVDEAYIVVEDEDTLTPVSSVPGRDGMWRKIIDSEIIEYRITNSSLAIKGSASNNGYIGRLPAIVNPGNKYLLPICCQHQDGNEVYGVGILKINESGEIYLIRNDGIPYDVDYTINILINI